MAQLFLVLLQQVLGMIRQRFGVAFDIDGVLTRTPDVLPGAKAALELLQSAQVPFCLMTNGGGSAEHVKAQQLNAKLGLSRQPLRPEQVCLAHTPMRGLVPTLRDRPVLLVGKHYAQIKEIAKTYGFQRAVTIEDLHARFPHLYPDIVPPPHFGATQSKSMSTNRDIDEGFAAILVFTDPIEWGRELQIVVDVLRAPGGRVAAVNSEFPKGGVETNRCFSQQGPLYMACSDFLYAAQWHDPRFGAGAFRTTLEHLWRQLYVSSSVGGDRQKAPGVTELRQTIYGKPFPAQYQYVETMLAEHSAETHEASVSASYMDRFYMIGDNPLTDIRGARNAGTHWRAILTRTGLWQGGENDEVDPADVVVDGVLEAVEWILDTEGCVK